MGIRGRFPGAEDAQGALWLGYKIKLNDLYTERIPVISGVKQGEPLSPTLFSLYVNDLIESINELNKGIPQGHQKITCLF